MNKPHNYKINQIVTNISPVNSGWCYSMEGKEYFLVRDDGRLNCFSGKRFLGSTDDLTQAKRLTRRYHKCYQRRN